jgi:hypothetical protein
MWKEAVVSERVLVKHLAKGTKRQENLSQDPMSGLRYTAVTFRTESKCVNHLNINVGL